MKWFNRYGYKIATLTVLIALPTLAQTPATASISGRVLSEDGRTVRATVALSFAAAKGYPAPPHRVLTDSTGAFSFSRLPAGRYVLCAQVDASETAPANSPYVDTCVWPSGQPPITLAAAQQLTGIVFTAPKGALLNLHVADPDRVLPPVSAKGPAPLEPELQLTLKGPDGLYHHARYLATDPSGRTYQIALPLKTAVALKISSTLANTFDQTGKQLQDQDEVGLQPNTPAELAPVSFTVHKK
jgi:Carboxypeptidase regulatory-like domain